MLLWNLDLLITEPLFFLQIMVMIIVALLIAITVHESSHALVAYWLGDDTARRAGRLSLNPLVHLDPLGCLTLLVVGVGWGKPVPVNPSYFRRGARSGTAMVSLAGPVANLVTAGVLALPIRLGVVAWHSPFHYFPFSRWNFEWLLADIIGFVILYSIILAIFNLIPIAPLDGFGVAVNILPHRLSYSLSRIGRYGPMILLMIIALGYLTRFNFLWGVITPVINFFAWIFVGRGF